MSSWATELAFIQTNAGVGVLGTNMFLGRRANIPSGVGPYLSIVLTAGLAPERTHYEATVPAYQLPGAQLLARARDWDDAYEMITAAYNAVIVVRNQFIGTTWYRSIKVAGEPLELTVDEKDRARFSLNIIGDKRPSVLSGVLVDYEVIELLGGDKFSFVNPTVSDAYPVGVTDDALVPGSWPVLLNGDFLTSYYTLEVNGRLDDLSGASGKRMKAALYNLDTDAMVAGSEITFSINETVGERKRSSPFRLPTGEHLLGFKATVNSTLVGQAGWGCRLLRIQ